MKRIVLCLALVMCGCTPDCLNTPHRMLLFQVGDIVDLKIGGQGQVIRIQGSSRPYNVRIRTDAGIERVWLDEFELEKP